LIGGGGAGGGSKNRSLGQTQMFFIILTGNKKSHVTFLEIGIINGTMVNWEHPMIPVLIHTWVTIYIHILSLKS